MNEHPEKEFVEAHIDDKKFKESVEKSCEWLNLGKILAYPTETLWGLGVKISDTRAVEKLFQLKSRDKIKAMSILVRDVQQAFEYAAVPHSAVDLLALYWPGPLTFILPRKESVPPEICGGSAWVGLRCSPHKFVRDLVRELSEPITTTSANKSGEPSALKRTDLNWSEEDDVLIAPGCEDQMEANAGSTVVQILSKEKDFGSSAQFTSGQVREYEDLKIEDLSLKVLRAGVLPIEDLRWACEKVGLEMSQ